LDAKKFFTKYNKRQKIVLHPIYHHTSETSNQKLKYQTPCEKSLNDKTHQP